MYERNYHSRVLTHGTSSSKRKRRRTFRLKRIATIFAVIAGVAGILILIRAPHFQVRTVNDVQVVGTHVADPTEVSRYVLGTFGGHYLLVLPKTSIFLISPDTVAAAVHRHFPRFKSVKVIRTGVHTLKVEVVEYPSSYLWCDSRGACSFMDASGVVFADAPYFSGNAYLKLSGGTRGNYPFTPLTTQNIAFVTTISARLQAIDITPLSFSFVSDHDVSIGFLHGGATAELLFDPSKDINASLQTLYSGLHTDPLDGLYHDAKKVLEYIDVRFDNKVVYKFQ